MAFYVGQKVECIKAVHPDWDKPPFLTIGAIYTVENIYEPLEGEFALELVELPQPGNDLVFPGFRADHFRPIVERKTSIAIFKAMLNPSKQEVEA